MSFLSTVIESKIGAICFWPLALLVSLAVPAAAQESSISIASRVDTTSATIGDQLHLTVEMSYPEGTRFRLPVIEERLGDFEVLDVRMDEEQKTARGRQRDWVLTLAVFDTGRAVIPAMEIAAISQEDSSRVLRYSTDEYSIDVISVLPPGTTEIKDIKKPFPLRRLLPWDYIIFVLLLLAIAGAGLFYYRRWQKRNAVLLLDEKYLEPPHVIALQRLEALQYEGDLSIAEIRQLCFAISEILREYLERRYFVRALEMSTSEIAGMIREADMASEYQIELIALLQDLDLVKFAKQTLAGGEAAAQWQRACRFVRQTRKQTDLYQSQESQQDSRVIVEE